MFSPNHYFMSQIVVCCKHSAHLQLGKFSHRKQFVVISHKVVLPSLHNPKPQTLAQEMMIAKKLSSVWINLASSTYKTQKK
jgi:hypothetical protein